MTYLVDTNVCIRILNGSSPAVVSRLRRLEPSDVAISTRDEHHGNHPHPRPWNAVPTPGDETHAPEADNGSEGKHGEDS